METMSLKALAQAVLHGNTQGNNVETNGNSEAPKKQGMETTVSGKKSAFAIISEEYDRLVLWLREQPWTGQDIRAVSQDLYDQIQGTIAQMDERFMAEDLEGFKGASDKLKKTYLEGARLIHERKIRR
ncbi:hypothetical protein NBG4_890013 [Candidatus Sulfobium mesophilum]|uniref:Uncharacterized protein n=1 Tax=Candidatus Sulfobium mesophilum TaxID=2016548 RepID=A0A2U3QL20_9BACT|nr:hypothetical protein NBG4_890013 [Candidatus Sulfobium mesophilum]